MNGRYESKISNCCVENLVNSPAIHYDFRLAFEYFGSYISPPRINQRFLKLKGRADKRLKPILKVIDQITPMLRLNS